MTRTLILTLTLSLLACSESTPRTLGDAAPADRSIQGDAPSADADRAGDGTTAADDASAADRGTLAPDGEAPINCAAATTVGDAPALIGVLDGLTWNWVGPYTSKLQIYSDDVEVQGKLTVAGHQLAVPPDCLSRSDCRQQVSFRLASAVSGVTCVKQQTEIPWLDSCDEIAIENTTVRFYAAHYDTHPSLYNFVPLITVVASCQTPCAAGALRCQANQSCFASFESYCRLCLERDKQACPCLTAAGNEADGTACDFMVSGDVVCSGECKDGFCQHTGTPGWAGCP